MLDFEEVNLAHSRRDLTDRVKKAAHSVGFGLVGISRIGPATHSDKFQNWLAKGNHLPMAMLEQGLANRIDPRNRYPWACSVISLGRLYGVEGASEETPAGLAELNQVLQRPATPPIPACIDDPDSWQNRDAAKRRLAQEIISRSPALGIWPWIARFERDANYHRINDGMLNRLAACLMQLTDPAPQVQTVIEHSSFFERDLGYQGGLGWIGKNNLLINPKLGSFFVLTSLFTDLKLEPDDQVADMCGTCTACLEACPTQALDGPHNIIVERCLSARSISIEGPVPSKYRETQAGHLSGCDICQDACPYNRKHGGSATGIGPAPARWQTATLFDLLECNEEERRLLFAGSLVARIGHSTLKRNVLLIAARILRIANGAPPNEAFDEIARQVDPVDLNPLRSAVEKHLTATDPAVQEAAIYAVNY